MRTPTKAHPCRSGHYHGTPEAALGCDALRWQTRLRELGYTDCIAIVHHWHHERLLDLATTREMLRDGIDPRAVPVSSRQLSLTL